MLPVTTTTVTIRRPAGDSDPYESPATTPLVAAGIPGHISDPVGTERNVGGAGERIDAIALLPACTDVQHADQLVDAATGTTYRVATVAARSGLGLDHVRCTLVAVAGGANG